MGNAEYMGGQHLELGVGRRVSMMTRWISLVAMVMVVMVAGVAMQAVEENTRKLYNGFQMIRAAPVGEDQLKLVESLEIAVDAWTPVVGFNKTMIDLTVEPKLIRVIKRLLR